METITPAAVPAAAPYTARILPPEEWNRLPDEVTRALHPLHSVVIVVEDLAGDIVARWVAMNQVYMEGLFIEEHARKNPAVAGRLLTLMMGTLRALGASSILTLVQETPVQHLAAHFGFTKVPGETFKLEL